MTRPTAKAVGLFALSVPVALVVAVAWPWLWFASLYLPALAAALIAADLTMTLPARRLADSTVAPVRLFLGQRGRVEVRLDAGRRGGGLPVTVLLEIRGDAESPRPARGTMADGVLELTLPLAPLRRGRLGLEALWLRWQGPLGLVEKMARRPIGKSVDVVPDIHGIHEEAVRFYDRDALFGSKSQSRHGEGSEFDKLCDYEPGMDSRFIDWKRSARHRKLLSKEFRQERNHQIVLGFDTGHLMLEPIDGMPKLDHAIRAGLTLGWISLHGGDLVGGCGFDARVRAFIQPGRGMPYFTQVQRFAAGLDYRTEETNFTLGLTEMDARLRRRALIVVFSDFVDEISAELLLESLRLITRRHLVVFVTLRDAALAGRVEARPDGFGTVAEAVLAGDFLRRRAMVLERVARMGVHCLDVPARGLSTALLNRYLLIKQRGLL